MVQFLRIDRFLETLAQFVMCKTELWILDSNKCLDENFRENHVTGERVPYSIDAALMLLTGTSPPRPSCPEAEFLIGTKVFKSSP